MKSRRKAGTAGRRERREFSAEFKAEAVRLVADRREAGGTLTQVGRELDVRPDQLRPWAPGARLCKNSGGVLREGVALRYAVITRHRGEFERRLMCRGLEVSPSGYSASLKRPPSWHAVIDEVLMAHVRIAHHESGETYGAPRVHRELQAAGLPTSTKCVARLMREEGLVARSPTRRRVSTTDSNHGDPIAPNLLARQFDVHGLALNRVWVADRTYIPTREGWLYLATVLDLGSRRCVGWAMRAHMEVDLPLSALGMAREARRPAPGLIHHSDRGSRDARVRADHAARLADEGGSPARDLPLHRDLVQSPAAPLEVGYISPVEYEAQWYEAQWPAVA
jgi:hypothetical protein